MSLTHTPITDELADYIRRVTLREPEVLRRLREEAEGDPHGSLQIAPEQGQFLHLMARILGASKTLEVGVFWGYSSAWVALALPPGGKLVACDCNTEYAARARRTWREAGVEDKIELRLGAGARNPGRAGGRRPCGHVRFRLHRRRQGELRELLRAVARCCFAPAG